MREYVKVKVCWEADGAKVELPKMVKIEKSINPEEWADRLSDKYGFLVNYLTY